MPIIDLTPKVEYTISIFPNPKDASIEAKIHFQSAAEKRLYLKMEGNHCINEYQDYSAAMNKDKRAKTYAALCAKRVAFARKMGYNPRKLNPKVWEKTSPSPPRPQSLA